MISQDPKTATALAHLVLLGAFIGAVAGIAGQLVTAFVSDRAERRRQAVDADFREWQALSEIAAERARAGHPAEMMPPALFVYYIRCTLWLRPEVVLSPRRDPERPDRPRH